MKTPSTNFAVVSFQVGDILEGDSRVDLNDVAMDSSEEMSTVAEQSFSTASNGEFFEWTKIID